MSNFSDPKWVAYVTAAQKEFPFGNSDPIGTIGQQRARAHDLSSAVDGLNALKYGDNRARGGKKFKSNKKAQSKRRKMSKKSQTKRRK